MQKDTFEQKSARSKQLRSLYCDRIPTIINCPQTSQCFKCLVPYDLTILDLFNFTINKLQTKNTSVMFVCEQKDIRNKINKQILFFNSAKNNNKISIESIDQQYQSADGILYLIHKFVML
jgi:hypothetical protein